MLLSLRPGLRRVFILSLFLASGHCTPKTSRISRTAVSNNSTGNSDISKGRPSVVNSTVEFRPKSPSPKIRERKADGFSVESIVSTIIASPDAMSQIHKLKNGIVNYFDSKSKGDSGAEARGHGHGGIHGHPHGGLGHGIGFPSLEGALLALAFLTFAVFLIDLIQQLVSRYRTGYASPLLGRRRRALTENQKLAQNRHLSTITSEVMTALEAPLFE